MVVLLSLFVSLASLALSIYAILHANRRIARSTEKIFEAGHAVCEQEGCGRVVARYFLDGAGRVTCANCKPEGYADALKRGTLSGK